MAQAESTHRGVSFPAETSIVPGLGASQEPSRDRPPLSSDDLAELVGDALAPAAFALLAVVRDAALDSDTRERARRALLCVDIDVRLGDLPSPLPVADPKARPLERVALDVATVLVQAILTADHRRRARLTRLLTEVAREAVLARATNAA